MFRSKDESLLEDFKKNGGLETDNYKFLDGKDHRIGQKIWFGSHPRSGNTFLRKYLELITGVATGADNPNLMSYQLQV